MLNIRGVNSLNSPKERLNEDVAEAISEIRLRSLVNMKPGLKIDNQNTASEKSAKTLTKSAISRAIGGSIKRSNYKLTEANSKRTHSASHFSGIRSGSSKKVTDLLSRFD